MVLKVGSWARWLDMSENLEKSGFFQGTDESGRLVFIGVNGKCTVHPTMRFRDQHGMLYTSVSTQEESGKVTLTC